MKISYLVPTASYSFFLEIVEPLRLLGFEMEINKISPASELVLAAILPATPEWIDKIPPDRPLVLWHWDYYSFVDKRQPRWSYFISLLPKAREIWSCSYETARQLKEALNLDSFVVPAWVCPSRFEKQPITENYVFYASSSGAFGKRTNWAEKACSLLGLRLILTKGQRLSKKEYTQTMAKCRVYLMPAFEESNGTIPAMEAGACSRAVVLSDIASNKEVFGSTAYYFKNCDFGDLLAQLSLAWDSGPKPEIRNRILKSFEVNYVTGLIAKRLKSCLQSI